MSGSRIYTLFDDPNPLCLNCGGPLTVDRDRRTVLCPACLWPEVQPPDYLFEPGRVDIDGRQLVVSIEPRTYGRATITAGRPEDHELGIYDQSWDYPDQQQAVYALLQWVGTSGMAEPAGWWRHKPSNRRRDGGDPAREHVRP